MVAISSHPLAFAGYCVLLFTGLVGASGYAESRELLALEAYLGSHKVDA